MKKKPNRPEQATELRQKAEAIAGKTAAQLSEDIESLSPEETRRVLHELRVHQIELELQNEELRRTQAELEISRARYFDLFDLAPVGYLTLNDKLLILEANLTAATLLDVDRGALVKQPLSRFIVKEDQDLFYLHRKQLVETGTPQTYELRLVKKDGTQFWVRLEADLTRDADGMPVYHAVLSDITDRKQAEEGLRETHNQLRATLDALPDLLFDVDAEGTIYDFLAPRPELLYASPSEFMGKKMKEILPPEAGKVISEAIAEAVKTGRHSGGVYWLELPPGRYWFELSIAAKDNSNLQHSRFIMLARDITGRKRAQEAQAKLEVQNRQLQKAESLGRMAGAIAHHFNNQLQAVMGNLELAMMDLPSQWGPSKNLSQAMVAAQKATEVSGSMLTYLGQTPAKLDLLYLAEACNRGLSHLRADIPKNVVLQTDLPSPGPAVSANETQIQRLLTNLVTNAREAIGAEQGTIRLSVKTVSAANIPAAPRVPPDWQPQGKHYACLEVTDSGGGIANRDIDLLFDPFFSNKFTGRGLGLPVVLGIVRVHAGVVTVKSRVGRGSTFRVFLPVTKQKVSLPAIERVFSPEKDLVGTVLLVEDEEMVSAITVQMLAYLGFTVLAAKDGVEAVEIFRRHQEEIRCVVCDLAMPRMDGWETLTALRQLSPALPVILASGYDETRAMAGDHHEQPQVFLGKPFHIEALKNALIRAMAK